MKRVLYLFIILLTMGINNASAQDYESMWRKIDQLVQADKPKSIIEEAEKIYALAKKDDNFPQMLKAQVCITERKCDLDPELFKADEYEKLIEDLENDHQLSATDKAGRLAVLHCTLASAFNEMSDSFIHDFDDETQEDYSEKTKEHLLAALNDMETLSRINNAKYDPYITQVNDGQLFNHDLLKVVIDFCFNNYRHHFLEEELISIHERAIQVYEANGNRNASTLLRLRVLSLKKESFTKSILISQDTYINELETLHSQTQDIETGADVDVALSSAYEDEDKKLALVRKAQIVWKDSKLLNHFKNVEAEIMASHINLKAQDNIIANKPFKLTINQENTTSATLTIREYAGRDSRGNLKETGTPISTHKYTFTLDEINQKRKDNQLPYSAEATDNITLPVGRYTIIAETDGDKSKIELSITSIRITSLCLPSGDNMLVSVLDNETGRPVPGATIMCFNSWRMEYGEKPVAKFVTDKNGEAIIPSKDANSRRSYYRMIAVRDASKYGTPSEDCSSDINTSSSYGPGEKKEEVKYHISTDRSVYRPGQTVHFSILKYKQFADNVEVLPNSEVKIEIHNPYYESIHTDQASTNELGSASFEYTIPTDCKLGSYDIRIDDDNYYRSYSIHIEEYKRPTFDVKFEEEANSTKYSLGDNAKVIGLAKTFSDIPVQNGEVNYTIEWCESNRYWRWIQNWQELTKGETTTNDSGEILIQFPTELPVVVTSDSISYRINVEVTDVNGEMQRGSFTFKVKNPDYKERPKEEEGPKDELKISSTEISESQDAIITFKAKEKDALVYYYILSNDKIEKRDTKVLNGDELKFTVKYKKEWGDGVTVHILYVRNGHYYYDNKELVYTRPNKKLNLAWSTFRDNLQPGQQEEWILSVKDKNNKVVSGAELLAVMYDASLDEIYGHDWEFKVDFARLIKNSYISHSQGNYAWSIYLSPKYTRLRAYSRVFDFMRQFEHQRWYKLQKKGRISGFGAASKMMTMNFSADKSADSLNMMLIEPEVAEEAIVTSGDVTNPQANASKALRTNLSELAFFYPHLVTDAKGEAHIAFTLPDCLTEWKFMGLVHTKDMDYGTITARATAKKDFMVQPNMPRFLRTGDKAMISAKIINMSEAEVKGTATLRILNAETEAEVYTTKVDFGIPTNQSTSLTFPISDTLSEGDYICEIIASDGSTTDGERNRLPILSTKVDVVENVPFYLDGASTKSVDLSGIFNQDSKTATDKTISVGYTDNPALSVFKSLRALQNPKHDNAPCFAAALYSNLVLLDMSKVLGDRLEDFDAATSQATIDKAIEKLQKLQLSDGSYTWFEGMSGSYYITLSVAESLSRLQSYISTHSVEDAPSAINTMLKKALKYLDKKTLEDYKYRKACKLPLCPYNDDIRYLSIATNPNKEMLNRYLDEMNKDFKNLTIFGRSQGVLIMKKYGRDAIAQKFIESVKEYTIFKEGFGRYFATDLAYYSWFDYRIPTQLAAMRAIEDKSYLLQMQLWLLRQKQTQTWDNPINALDIADFLLTNDRETSLHEVTIPTLILNGTPIKPDSIYQAPPSEAGGLLTVTKTSPGISWGHVRSTFKEEVNNLQSYSSGELTIERKVIRDGNKVTIRHILHADRDMDFVQVTSQHAASLEPLRTLSGYQWMGGRGCYLEVHDSYISLFFDKFTRGTTTIDMEYYIAREGEYNTGYANIECTYAPEFGGHTAGNILKYNK